MSDFLHRAEFFIARRRFPEAEAEVRRALAEEPERADAWAMLGLVHLACERLDEALECARAAVGHDPTSTYALYVLTRVHDRREEPGQAAAAIAAAVRLDPGDAHLVAEEARLHLVADRHREALAAAERGLAIDPDHRGCNDLRARALVLLGRADEAADAVQANLARDPEDADAHVTLGYLRLKAGRHAEALASFREALRLDPSHPSARAGLVEGLKARHSLYGLFLRYVFAMEKLGQKAGWGLIIGLWLGYRFLLKLSREHPEWGVYLYPLIGLYIGFFLFTWTASSIFNWLLSLDRFGRLTLDPDERRHARWTGAALAGVAAAGALWATVPGFPGGVAMAGFLVFLIPLSIVYACPPGPGVRLAAGALAAVLATLGLESLLLALGAPLFPEAERPLAGKLSGVLGLGYFVGIGLLSFGGQLLPGLGRRLRPRRGADSQAESGRWTLLAFLGVALLVSLLASLARTATRGLDGTVLVRTALSVGLGYALYRGRSWARWLTVALAGAAAAFGVVLLARSSPGVVVWAALLPLVLFYAAFAVWLVLSKDLRAYLALRAREG